MDTFISKKRGAFLTVVIFLQTLFLINNLFSPRNKYHLIFILISFGLLWGIWLWKKWAVYAKFILDGLVYTLVALVSLSDAAKVSEPIFILLGAFVVIVLAFILTDGLLIWAIKRKWKYFS